MTKALRIGDYLQHILEALERIDRYTAGMDVASFMTPVLHARIAALCNCAGAPQPQLRGDRNGQAG